MWQNDREVNGREAWQRVVGTANLIEINLPVDGSPRSRIRVYICTYPPSSLRACALPSVPTFHRLQVTVIPASPSPAPHNSVGLHPVRGKDRLINSAALVINSTPVKRRDHHRVLTLGARRRAAR